MSEKYKKTSKYLNYVKNILILVSTVTGPVSFSVFASLVFVLVGITSSAVWVTICAIIAGIKKYKLIIKKRKEEVRQNISARKHKLNTNEVLISKVLIDSCISNDKIVSVNNVSKEYYEMK